ncbi:MAG TPA: glycogen synthase GlgA [Kofleriaceae bacterium]|nr:glycogen synthase GlgA [Kofleriaceae bacterium]
MIRVVHVASEITPWSQTGGLGEVMGGLPPALAAADPSLAIAVVTPLYRVVRERAAARGATLEDIGLDLVVALPAADHSARLVRLVAGEGGGASCFFVDCPALYDRDGVYGGPSGDHPDNWLRFGVLCRAAIAASRHMLGGPADVVHAHDWQAALVPLLLRRAGLAARSILTVHNLLFLGGFGAEVVSGLGLDASLYTPHCLEHHGQASLLKGGLAAADRVTTVSPSYAAEILTPRHGDSLHGFLQHDVRGVTGILNGIDDAAWDPSRDPSLAARYGPDDLDGKRRCRAALAEERGLRPGSGDLLIGVVSRLTGQKGADLVAELVPELYRVGGKLVLLGSGAPELEERFRWLADRFRDHLSVEIGFDPALARRILAGSDVVLMPSRTEPCGLTQLYAMRYGAVPIVNPVGGLRDTVDAVEDGLDGQGTGFAMTDPSAAALHRALERAALLHRDEAAWTALVRAGMRRDSSWRGPAAEYAALYRELAGAGAGA